MKSLVKHYKLQPDGSLRFVGDEIHEYSIKECPLQPETKVVLGERASNGRRTVVLAGSPKKRGRRIDAQKQTDADADEDNDLENDGSAISDDGCGAAAVRSFDEPAEPEWVYDFRIRESELNHTPRDIVRAFKKLWDPFDVMVKLGLDEKSFGAFLKKIKNHFDQCFRAYHAWLAEKSLRVC